MEIFWFKYNVELGLYLEQISVVDSVQFVSTCAWLFAQRFMVPTCDSKHNMALWCLSDVQHVAQ